MAYVVETDVERFGYLHGGVESIPPLATVEHPWTTPFPTLVDDVEFTWEPGSSPTRPNVLHHNLLRDFACDLTTYRFLEELLRGQLHVVARGHCADAPLVVLQATDVLDVVDVERSIPYQYASGGVSFPHIPPEREGVVRGRFFRVPNPGLSLTVLVADDVAQEIQRAGITGWRLEPATVSDD